MAGKMITAVLVHVHTTIDDKDVEIEFEFAIKHGDKTLGSVRAGGGQLWVDEGDHGGDQRDIRVPLNTPFPYEKRLELSLAHIYHNTAGGNQGWGGKDSAKVELEGGQIRPVLTETRTFKLGESGNPKEEVFPFNT